MPQNESAAEAEAQLALVDVPWFRRFASPQVPAVVPVVFLHVGSHEYTVIVDVVPPLLKSLITKMSPVLCTPVKPEPPPTLLLPWAILFWKNQKPSCASPLLSRRSDPKYSTSPSDVDGYRAAKLCNRLSLAGSPPAPSFHAHWPMSFGSLDPPVVKIDEFTFGSATQLTALAPLVLLVVPQSLPVTW